MLEWTSEVVRLSINFGSLFVGCFASVNFIIFTNKLKEIVVQ